MFIEELQLNAGVEYRYKIFAIFDYRVVSETYLDSNAHLQRKSV